MNRVVMKSLGIRCLALLASVALAGCAAEQGSTTSTEDPGAAQGSDTRSTHAVERLETTPTTPASAASLAPPSLRAERVSNAISSGDPLNFDGDENHGPQPEPWNTTSTDGEGDQAAPQPEPWNHKFQLVPTTAVETHKP